MRSCSIGSKYFTSESKRPPPSKIPAPKTPSREELQWRVPWGNQKDEWYTKFKLFAPEKPDNARMIKLLQSNIDLRPSAVLKWFKKRKETIIALDQKFVPERLNALGNELAAAHFIVHRGGSIKFFSENKWVTRDKYGEYELPTIYDSKYLIEGITCEGLPLNYDGLENFRGLRQIKFFSVKDCMFIDDWCVDRISGQFFDSLEELDLRNCKVTPFGLEALYRMHKLKVLKLTKLPSEHYELVCLLLEELFPKLKIEHY